MEGTAGREDGKMALRQLMIGQRMAALRQEREALVTAMEELRTRRTAWEEREARAVPASKAMTVGRCVHSCTSIF